MYGVFEYKKRPRFKGRKNIWGYDLCNEPCQNTPVPFNYWDCQYRAAKAIREIDPHTPVIIESNGMCGIGSYADMQPLPLKNINCDHVDFINPALIP